MKTVLTNGCFDILTVSHVRLLARCREYGDHLVVALNSDESVRRLKGDKRPINVFAYRYEVLRALRSVDVVVSFDTERELELLIQGLRPVLVKGPPYKSAAELTGAKHASQVVILPALSEVTTTGLYFAERQALCQS